MLCVHVSVHGAHRHKTFAFLSSFATLHVMDDTNLQDEVLGYFQNTDYGLFQ